MKKKHKDPVLSTMVSINMQTVKVAVRWWNYATLDSKVFAFIVTLA